MNAKPSQYRNKPKGRIKKPDPATEAARDPQHRATNRAGFDLGGAVGDAKPDEQSPTLQARDTVRGNRLERRAQCGALSAA